MEKDTENTAAPSVRHLEEALNAVVLCTDGEERRLLEIEDRLLHYEVEINGGRWMRLSGARRWEAEPLFVGGAFVANADSADGPTPSRYKWEWKGVSFDFYRLCEILGITHQAHAHALKKTIRAGRSIKSTEQDIDGYRRTTALERDDPRRSAER